MWRRKSAKTSQGKRWTHSGKPEGWPPLTIGKVENCRECKIGTGREMPSRPEKTEKAERILSL